MLDLEAVDNVRDLIARVPEIDVDDVSRYLFISGIILQKEAYKVVAELEGVADSSKKMRRLYLVDKILSTAGGLLKESADLKVKVERERIRRSGKIGAGRGLYLENGVAVAAVSESDTE